MTSAAQSERHPGALIALEARARRKWALLGAPLALALLVLLSMGSSSAMPTSMLALYGTPGAYMLYVFATTDAWLDDHGLHHRSTMTWGRTVLIPANQIAGAEISADTLRIRRVSGKPIDVVAVRGRFVGQLVLEKWVDVVNRARAAS